MRSIQARRPARALLLALALTTGCASGGDPDSLVAAVRAGDETRVQRLLEAGGDPAERDSKGAPALYWAAESGKLAIARRLLEAGAPTEPPFDPRYAPLLRAASAGEADVVALLLEFGADPGIATATGVNALHEAAGRGHAAVARLLLEAGADPDLQEYDGDTALLNAAAYGHVEIVALLLEHGADPTIPGGAGKTPREYARDEGHSEVVALLRGAEKDFEGNAARPPVRTAARDAAGSTPPPPDGPARPERFGAHYQRRLAAVIGINDYRSWPALDGATGDARRVAEALRAQGFDEVLELYDEQATRSRVLQLLSRDLAQRATAEDLVVIYFAGHGHTETLPSGEKRGYVIPVDGTTEGVFSTAISMQQLRKLADRLAAKHVYYAMDSCYSGLGFTRGITVVDKSDDYIEKVTTMRAVQMVTAGMEGEEAIEQEGQGLFTSSFLRALRGEADFDGDGFVTASEIGLFVRPDVTSRSRSRQTPQFGTVEGQGEVVFRVKN